MCEGPNELEIVRILLENDKLIFQPDDLLNLVPYHARQITSNPAVKMALDFYSGEVCVLRIGDKLNEALKIPKEHQKKIKEIRKYCTKPELEMLLIISEKKEADFNKVKSRQSPKAFSKMNIKYGRTKYNNSTLFYREYYGLRVELLVSSIKRYKHLQGKHQKDELYLADLLK